MRKLSTKFLFNKENITKTGWLNFVAIIPLNPVSLGLLVSLCVLSLSLLILFYVVLACLNLYTN